MMYEHFIIIHPGYRSGRIAFHKCYEDSSKIKEFMKYKKKLKEEFKNVNFSVHHLPTSKKTFESVKDYDPYFEGIKIVKKFDDFRLEIKKDLTISVDDVAKIILLKKDYSQLELLKTIYLVYAEYLKKYDEKLFEEDFEAWDHGPVIRSIYDKSKKYKNKKIDKYQGDDELKMQILSRKRKIKNYDKVLEIVDYTLNKYKDLNIWNKRDLTHIKGGAWDKTYKEGLGKNNNISFELIKEDIKHDKYKVY